MDVGKILKREITHFKDLPQIFDFEAVKVSKNDGVYGIMRGRLVRDYLGTAYSGAAAEAEIVSEGVTYKVLKRGEVTAFYDADGNTLFDVENKRLEKEYGRLVKEEAAEPDGDKEKVSAKQSAKEKLEKELKGDKDKTFAEPVIAYLLGRCAEDEGLSLDVVQEHKTWKKYAGFQTRGNGHSIAF